MAAIPAPCGREVSIQKCSEEEAEGLTVVVDDAGIVRVLVVRSRKLEEAAQGVDFVLRIPFHFSVHGQTPQIECNTHFALKNSLIIHRAVHDDSLVLLQHSSGRALTG